MTDLELLHNYTCTTYLTLSDNSVCTPKYKICDNNQPLYYITLNTPNTPSSNTAGILRELNIALVWRC